MDAISRGERLSLLGSIRRPRQVFKTRMANRIAQDKYETVVQLLADGVPFKQIARVTGVNVVTVRTISRETEAREYEPEEVDVPGIPPEGTKPERCPTCGGLVFMPCVFCLAKGDGRSN